MIQNLIRGYKITKIEEVIMKFTDHRLRKIVYYTRATTFLTISVLGIPSYMHSSLFLFRYV